MPSNAAACWPRVTTGPMRVSACARIADLGDLELGRKRLGDRVGLIRRHEDAADRGAFLPGLHRHLAHDLAHEGIEGRAAGRASPAQAAPR